MPNIYKNFFFRNEKKCVCYNDLDPKQKQYGG